MRDSFVRRRLARLFDIVFLWKSLEKASVTETKVKLIVFLNKMTKENAKIFKYLMDILDA